MNIEERYKVLCVLPRTTLESVLLSKFQTSVFPSWDDWSVIVLILSLEYTSLQVLEFMGSPAPSLE